MNGTRYNEHRDIFRARERGAKRRERVGISVDTSNTIDNYLFQFLVYGQTGCWGLLSIGYMGSWRSCFERARNSSL
ncbi:hypothetical protein M419DRAFT_119828 [Trichoderma reesei RUT C-30]|uniref:Uncharacterized protein n=1 Tax=Hypocrea jecorina (strain ATCC 56765 / BCRC 32924 / NRRL 11460 / Rut C-30) TaxID=1344414 RepID=A0A024S4Z8_HYPJR|nr:hypothetical protein M419DRAFT_119828 [Trichoderma reesei RUT C-30]